ncbi:MAG: biopolymer transporter ExbD [Myxococcales bacterium]|nr:biopolymer transporter ExbD [Myxococcales bacterium]
MRSLSRAGTRPEPVMNVTPLVDVVLVLLIIFMVVIPAMEKNAPVELPSIFNVDPEAKGKMDPFTLSVTQDGAYFFEQQELPQEELAKVLEAANLKEPGRRLVLRADRETRYADVRDLFKTCQKIGFPGMSLRVNELGGEKK